MRLDKAFARLPGTIQKAAFVVAASAMLRASGILVFILIGRLSGPEDAGVFALALGYLAILTTLFGGIDDLLIREVAAAPGNVLTSVAAYSVLRAPAAVLLYGIAVLFGQTVNQVPAEQIIVLYLIVLSAVFDSVMGIGQAILYAFGGFKSLIYSAVAVLFVRAGIGGIALAAGGMIATAALWPISSLIGAMVVTMSAIEVVKASGVSLSPLVFEWPIVRRLGRLMPGFGAVSLLSALEYQCDVILLSALQPPSSVAVYAAAASIINILTLISQAYRAVLYPRLVRMRDEAADVTRRFVLRSARNMLLLGLLIASGTVLATPWLVQGVFGARFQASEHVLMVLIWNVVFLFVNVPFVRYLVAIGQQNRVAGALLISLSVNLGFNWLLIPRFGPQGSAWSRLVSSAVFLFAISLLVVCQWRQIQRDKSAGTIEVIR